MSPPVLLWLRRDLRLSDQPALMAALSSGAAVIPVYVLDDETSRHRRLGAASRWWLHHSLESLSRDLVARGSALVLRRGRADEALATLAHEVGAGEVFALEHHEPWWRKAERAVERAGLSLRLFPGNFLASVGSVVNGAGQPYRIYTPFWRALNERMPPPLPSPAPERIPAPEHWPASDDLADWNLLPTGPDWAGGIRGEWTPGEGGAAVRLAGFAGIAGHYDARRNLPSRSGTSRLSPHLAFGEISPGQCWHALSGAGGSVGVFLSELGWRDYAQNVIAAIPDYGARPAKPAFERMVWREGAEAEADFAAWCRGRTGYPIVDAGMRELWATGWMHNRVRMIAASFLIKHLLIDWRRGEQWFWDTLVDADYAQNAVNWQWSAGTGVDANLFTRIMAPLTQSPKFEAGDYIRRWVPELAGLDDGEVHDPSPLVRRRCGYVETLVGHAAGRARALAAFAGVKGGGE